MKQKLADKTAVIGIIGLGYVGLPLAIAFARAGFRVLGFDTQSKKINLVNKGESYIDDISNKELAVVSPKRLLATSDMGRLNEPDVICICVPTPLSKSREPDLSHVIQASKAITKCLRQWQLVILESTTYPGTTKEVVLPVLEKSGLKTGRDFYLAYSPERVDPGNKKYGLKNTPKVVGGIDKTSTELAVILYSQVADTVIPVSSMAVAEMAKIFENTFRHVNIALVNEIAQLCEKMGISVWEVIDTASTKPFGYMPFYPGPGVGGHCIPLDPSYLASKAKEYDFSTRFIELAGEINTRMPHYLTSRIMEALDSRGKSLKGARVMVVGVAYKKDITDTRESPALKLAQLLDQKGAIIRYNDPYIPSITLGKTVLKSIELTEANLSRADCTVIATAHTSYNIKTIVKASKLVFDCRGVTRGISGDNIIRLGE
ncbi:MAG: nucleotide sugar dehydrogenase [Dehalococcoidales bacterium]|nr:nucleotide sugar dehydrogenase [Dehalococcoidales bacterium]